MLVGEAPNLFLLDVDFQVAVLNPRNILLPDLLCRLLVQLWVIETDVDAGSEGLVKGADAIGG